MQDKEVVVRGDLIYLRKPPNRCVESILSKEVISDADYNRLRTMLYFGEGAWRAYGRSYEEVIASVRESMRNLPPAIGKAVKRIWVIDKFDLERIKFKLLMKGYSKAVFPNSTYVYLAPENRRIREILV